MPGNATTKPEKTEEGTLIVVEEVAFRAEVFAETCSAVRTVLLHLSTDEMVFFFMWCVAGNTNSGRRTLSLLRQGTYILFFVAERADNQLDVVTGKHVAVVDADLQRVLGFVVAVPATKYLAAARRPYLASPPVVHAPVLLWSGVTVHRSRLSSLLLLCSFLIPD